MAVLSRTPGAAATRRLQLLARPVPPAAIWAEGPCGGAAAAQAPGRPAEAQAAPEGRSRLRSGPGGGAEAGDGRQAPQPAARGLTVERGGAA